MSKSHFAEHFNHGARNKGVEPLLTLGDLVPSMGADRVEDILHGLPQIAVEVIRGAESASLTLIGADGAPATAVFTSVMAQGMDGVQYEAFEGPCLEAAAAAQWTAILVEDLQDGTRWPALTVPGAATWARSVLSVSLFAGPHPGAGGVQQAVGSLNLYAGQAETFGGSERDTALLLALYAALALAATEAMNEAGEHIDRLKAAMATQTVIGQAQGILMERHKFTAGQAFDRLRRASMNLNRKLRDVASDLSETGEEIVTTAGQRSTSEESARIEAVARYDILDTSPDVAFDRVAAIAAKLFEVPMATVCIVDSDRIWFKASLGLDGVQEVSREPGLGASAIMQGEPYLVTHARTDPRTASHPFVTGEMGLQFFASAPIISADGHALGSVSVMDTEPRDATPEQLAMLVDLAAVVMDQLELRLMVLTALRDSR